MFYVLAGIGAHLAIHGANILSAKRASLAKPAAWLAGWALWSFSVLMAVGSSEKVPVPHGLVWFGWVLLVASGVFTGYSLFITIPAIETYLHPNARLKLVTRGVYSLVRHPWLLGYVPFMFAIFLVSQSRLSLVEAPLFSAMATVGVVVQDRLIFAHAFAGYDKYSADTPMLVPSRKSLSAFADCLRLARSQENPEQEV